MYRGEGGGLDSNDCECTGVRGVVWIAMIVSVQGEGGGLDSNARVYRGRGVV